MNEGPPCYENIEQVHEMIVKDEILTEDCKQALLQYSADTNVHSELHLTFGEALRYVFSRIQSNPNACLLYTSPSPRDRTRSRMPSSA